MLLRASGEQAAGDLDLQVVVGRSTDADGGIAHGAQLRRFAVAVISADPQQIVAAREALVVAVGTERAAQAAGIVAGFDAINRVADATGIALDRRSEGTTLDLVEDLELAGMRNDVRAAEAAR